MIRRLVTTLVLLPLLAPAATAATPEGVSVSLDRTAATTRVGHSIVFRSTIVNHGRSMMPLIAHLNVLSLRNGVYVDPEDWSSHRTRYLDPIPPRRSRTLAWRINAVNAGSIGIYVAVLPRSGAIRPTAGPMLRLDVTARRTLNSGGIAPLAIGVPAVLLAVLLVVRVRRRRMTA